ncbi:DUF5667 domain-containing protein [Aquibacillus salsiterrae]|uniref:DUF5667 domain-containing protein n=1 Tax=Aquibacillus salsiterrae TaxID=2950439 RepID=A0A9X4AGQ8_9BACI|nr:DUF5667 domain-containing protein [Aquibacillus salsiterrae]MDC3417383.1 DUF5667 domain-containing protein [Aquibacillus salsiterrae]
MENKKVRHFITSGLVASAFILTTNFGTVLAEEDGENNTSEVITETNQGQVDEQLADLTAELDLEEPSLLPGDFFYFAKIMLENIRSAFTFNDYAKAKLYADFAAERIAEANALIAEGETDKAQELLKEAIQRQEEANETSSSNEGDEQAQDTALRVEMPDQEVTTSEDVEISDEAEDSDDQAEVEEVDELDNRFANNIDSLLLVLEKIDNPKARAAIAKNIQKSFAKLDKKMEKLAALEIKIDEKMKEIEEEIANGEISEDEADEQIENLQAEVENDLDEADQEEEKDTAEIKAEVTKTVSDTAKEIAKEKQEEAKEKREEAKEKAKEKREEAKKKREEAKNARKENSKYEKDGEEEQDKFNEDDKEDEEHKKDEDEDEDNDDE